MFQHIQLQLKHFSFKGRNQWSGAFVCVGGATIQGAPSRTLWYYFNVASCNCVERVCFFPRGQTEDNPHRSHSIPGWPAEVALVWDLFEVPPAERASLKKHCSAPPSRPAGSGAGGRCVLKSTAQNQGALCVEDFFMCVFEADLWQVNTATPYSEDSDLNESGWRTSFIPCWTFFTVQVTYFNSQLSWISEWLLEVENVRSVTFVV